MENCLICGSNNISKTKYFYKNKDSILRKIIYFLPINILKIFSKFEFLTFNKTLKEIIYNRKTFSGNKIYCFSCKTGWHDPIISDDKLNNYYKKFYWVHRSIKETIFDFNLNKPDYKRLTYVEDQILYLKNKSIKFQSVLDFGAGDCVGAYYFKNIMDKKNVSIYDPSDSSKNLAKRYGLEVIQSLKNKKFDLVYSSHSVEHVSDINLTLNNIRNILSKRGFVFFETPNISSQEVFLHLIHTPHTYMFSIDSFKFIAQNYGFKIIDIQYAGPRWKKTFYNLKDTSKADLRVIMQKI